MANNAHISDDDIAQVLQGNVLADMSRLVFRDPDHFRAGELHRHVVCRLYTFYLHFYFFFFLQQNNLNYVDPQIANLLFERVNHQQTFVTIYKENLKKTKELDIVK